MAYWCACHFIRTQISWIRFKHPKRWQAQEVNSASMHMWNTEELTGVPATIASVLYGPQCPTWWRCGQRPLKTAASGQGPTTGFLHFLERTKEYLWHVLFCTARTCGGQFYDVACWLHLVHARRTTGKSNKRSQVPFKTTHMGGTQKSDTAFSPYF